MSTNAAGTDSVDRYLAEFDEMMERGLRWRELLPDGRYAWELIDEEADYEVVGYWVLHKKGGTLRTWLAAADPTQDVREVAPRLHELMQEPEHDRDYVVASLVEEPTWYAKNYGQHTGRCGFCNRPLTDPESQRRGIGPDCWASIPTIR